MEIANMKEEGKGIFGSGNSICKDTESYNRMMFAEKGMAVLCVGVKAT